MAVVPQRTVRPVAVASVAAEAAAVVLLATPARWSGAAGFVLAAGLLAVFGWAVVRSVRAGNTAPCRCFGASSTPLGMRHVVRNGVLVLVALVGLAGALAAGRVDLGAAFVAAGAGLVAGVLVAAYDDIAELLGP